LRLDSKRQATQMSKHAGNKEIRRYFNPKGFRSSKYSDADIDVVVSSAEARLGEIAVRELALHDVDDLSDVITVRYPNFLITPDVSRDDIHVRLGRDGTFRFSSYSFHLVFVTRNHLSSYTATWNVITDAISEGDWEEWPYRHIVSVNAGSLEEELPAVDRKARKRLKKYGPDVAVVGYYFAVSNAGGGRLYASIDDKPIRQLLDDKLAKNDRIDKRLAAMRPMANHFKSCQNRLRDKIRDREEALSHEATGGLDPAIPPPLAPFADPAAPIPHDEEA
jgi:hypothetical protein